jgi:hypothetical protein
MRKACFLATLLITACPCVPRALALDCGPPPQQFTDNVDVQGKAQVQGLLKKLFDGSVEGKVSVVAQDLLSKYPNADRTVIVLGLLSMYCQMISASGNTEDKQLEMLGKANEELLKWESAPHSSDDPSARLKSAIKELVDFPDEQEAPQPPTYIQHLIRDKLPQKLFNLLSRFDEAQIRAVDSNGAQLYKFKKDYYVFQANAKTWEQNLVTHIGELLHGTPLDYSEAWVIYGKYVVMRVVGMSKDQIIANGNFLNYGITWDDTERIFGELSKEPEFVTQSRAISAAAANMSVEAKEATSST